LPARTTVKEVIDGQQRSQAIFDFARDNFSITLKTSDFFGKRFSTLDSNEQNVFLDYQIAADLLIAATDEEVRELFRRMNSYTAPLNKQSCATPRIKGRLSGSFSILPNGTQER
jgi:uncharacterized protein with ParB-like and HNH nuclease domain